MYYQYVESKCEVNDGYQQLPAGPASQNNSLLICVGVIDPIGSSYFKFARPVQVRQFDGNLTVLENEVLQTGGTLSRFVDIGSPGLITSYTIAVIEAITQARLNGSTSSKGAVVKY